MLSQLSPRRQSIHLIIKLCLLLLTNLSSVSSFSCCGGAPFMRRPTSSMQTLRKRYQQSKETTLLSSLSIPSQLFSARNDDQNTEDSISRSVGRGMYTDGGVIMPEGGANPCVIKVREMDNKRR